LNIFDKAIAFVSPRTALKRETARTRLSYLQRLQNSGYDQSGASTQKKSMKGWTATSKTPQEDIDANLHTLRQRSRDLYMSAPLAVSAIKTNRTNVIGAGLKLKARIDYKRLGLTREQAEEWELKTEKEFALWAESKWCDTLRLNNFYELQQLALMSWLMNGDAWGIIKHSEPTIWMPYGLKLHLIEADRISTPNLSQATVSFLSQKTYTVGQAKNGNYIYNGVEIDDNGAIVAYHICNQYPNSNLKGYKKEWVRVEAFGANTGNPNVLQLMEQERCEQYRGIPYLTPVIEALKQITRYTEAELTAAVVQAFFTAFIKYEGPKNEIPFGEVIPEDQQVDEDPNSYELGAGTINVLGPNEDVAFADPTRPSSGFEGFVNNITKQIGAALEIPHELLTKNFMASYSASRAALLEAWKAFKMRRTWFSSDFTQPVYELWLSEAVARGRIIAPGFFNDPVIKAAWAKAEWIGPAQGQLDPNKEVEAAIKRCSEGFSTRERETYELTGGNWDDNIQQIARENELLAKANPVQKEEVKEGNGKEAKD
jgi:lambda family phage portal protein